KELAQDAARRSYAVPSFCAWSAEAAKTILETAELLNAPVILMHSWSEISITGPQVVSAWARRLIQEHPVPASLHLDHGRSMDQVVRCLEAGYTSVMLDLSPLPFEENAAGMREAVGAARRSGASVEGELGAVGRTDQVTGEGGPASSLTDPEDAALFVERTGVDLLAVSIGNSHGLYTTLPHLDFERLAGIHRRVGVPLVLHGGSGTPEEDLKRAVSLGIAKINVASELVQAVRDSLTEQWGSGRNLWLPFAFRPALERMAEVVKRWLVRTGAAGKA
ncbi:MAG: class II fructose-bisphosphate aldolase, partial [Spirochaetota bacterium]